MITKEQTDIQVNKVLAFPKETVEKAIKENKLLLLNIRDEGQRLQCVESINNLIVNPKNEEILGQSEFPSDLETKTIPCQYLPKNEIIAELERFVDNQEWVEKSQDSLTSEKRPNYFKFYTLHIKDLRESVYDNTVAVWLQRLIHAIQGKEKRNCYIKLITSSLEKINKTIEEVVELVSTVLIQKAKGCDDENIKSGSLTEIYEKEIGKNEINEKDIEKYHNNIPKYGIDEIGKIIEGIKLRKNEKYKLIMERHFLPPALVINFKDGKVPDEFKKEFKKKFKEIKVKGKHIKAEHGELKEGGKAVYLPDEVLEPFLKEIIKEFKYEKSKKNSTYSIKDLAEIAEKRMQVRIKKGDDPELCGRKNYKPNRFETFLCNLINNKPLR